MPQWIDIGHANDFPPGSKQCLDPKGIPLVVCHPDTGLAVVANTCPHAGLPLGDGELRARVLTCPHHGYAYDVTTGRNIDFPHEELPLTTYPVRLTTDGRVQVQL